MIESPSARWLEHGRRLHLQHGPIDLIIEAAGDRDESMLAYVQARQAFDDLLPTLAEELPLLRTDSRTLRRQQWAVHGPVAHRMLEAVSPHSRDFVTPMACVAGAVADHVLNALCAERLLDSAYVNNGGDIALHLAPSERWKIGICTDVARATIGARVTVAQADGIGGVATSGWSGRSHSLGIADAVTVLASDAASADVAATLIANAVDVPDSSRITRVPASTLSPDSDLGDHAVTTAVGTLESSERRQALEAGMDRAECMKAAGLIHAAFLCLQGEQRVTGLDALRLER